MTSTARSDPLRSMSTRRHPLSCAECRRLKLRCTRIFPCTNCVKKGIESICPDAALITKQANRFIPANAELLQEKIGELSNRVRQLEDALSQSHSSHSKDPHPLLKAELLMINQPLRKEKPTGSSTEEESLLKSIGSLSISPQGQETWFGETVNSWYLLRQGEDPSPGEGIEAPEEPTQPDVPCISFIFPLTLGVDEARDSVRRSVVGLRPTAQVARKISEIYYMYGTWVCEPISLAEYNRRVFYPIYDHNADPHRESLDMNNFAIFYMVLALGAFLDPEEPSHSPEAFQYYQLGRGALYLVSSLEGDSIGTIQALLLMVQFMLLADIVGRWSVMGLVVKLAYSTGLHRDGDKWGLNFRDTQLRRELMWETYSYDSWQTLTFARPPSFSNAHIDCRPPDNSQISSDDAEVAYTAWKYQFSSECMSVVFEQVFCVRLPDYKRLQELDKKIKSFPLPPSLRVPGYGTTNVGDEFEQPRVETTLRRLGATAIKELTLFYMHRNFFARAMEDNPDDPLASQYSPSVLACYSSAYTFVALTDDLSKQHHVLAERLWFTFAHAFSCAIVLGTIAAKSHMSLAPSALSHFESACNLFDRVSSNPRAVKIFPVLRKLKEQAYPSRWQLDGAAEPPQSTSSSLFDSNSTSSSSSLASQSTTMSLPLPRQGFRPLPSTEEASTSRQEYSQTKDFDDFSLYPMVQGQLGDAQAYTTSSQIYMGTHDPEYVLGLPGVLSLPSNFHHEPMVPPLSDIAMSWENFLSQFNI